MKNLISRIARNRTEDGFTLLELAIGVVVLGIVAVIAVSAGIKTANEGMSREALKKDVFLTKMSVESYVLEGYTDFFALPLDAYHVSDEVGNRIELSGNYANFTVIGTAADGSNYCYNSVFDRFGEDVCP